MFDTLFKLYAGLDERLRREDGQAMAEYALIVAVISLSAIGVFAAVRADILNAFTRLTSAL